METEKVREIGLKEGLRGRKLWRFERFMALRLPEEFDPAYTAEWAQRFDRHNEYIMGDRDTLITLRIIDIQQERLEDMGFFDYPELIDAEDISYSEPREILE
jgi:hypothetical protein